MSDTRKGKNPSPSDPIAVAGPQEQAMLQALNALEQG